jgi:hypothetical protein
MEEQLVIGVMCSGQGYSRKQQQLRQHQSCGWSWCGLHCRTTCCCFMSLGGADTIYLVLRGNIQYCCTASTLDLVTTFWKSYFISCTNYNTVTFAYLCFLQ